MKKSILLILILFSIVVSIEVMATCTVEFNKATNYSATETISAQMACSEATEKSKDYTLTWVNCTDSDGTTLETDTGTTPSTANENFYDTYDIPSTFTTGCINATLTGTNLEGDDTANISGASAASILLTSATIGGKYIGEPTSITVTAKDENDKKLSGGLCKFSVWSNDETHMINHGTDKMYDGEAKFMFILGQVDVNEGTDYAIKVLCMCGSNGSEQECIDEDGASIEDSTGSILTPFTTNTWLVTTTHTSKTTQNLKEHNTVSVNISNQRSDMRIPLDILYDCRIDEGDTSLLRIKSPFYFPACDNQGECSATRGISASATQHQSMDFVVDEHPYLQGRNTTAYCSVYINIIDVLNGDKMTYAQTSNAFTITSDELNLELDWQWVSGSRLNSIVNLSAPSFNDYNGTGVGNIDLRIHSELNELDITEAFDLLNKIQNLTVKNKSDTLIEHEHYEIEFLEDDNIEIEIRDVPLSKDNENTWWNITLDFEDLEKRQTQALENQSYFLNESAVALKDIANKTGTFFLDISCPSMAEVGSVIDCSITAYVEDSQQVEKEVDFTCYIKDGNDQYSTHNFNKMVSRTPMTITKQFTMPLHLVGNTEYQVYCEAGYYNLGSRTDTFYTTVLAKEKSGESYTIKYLEKKDIGDRIFDPIMRLLKLPILLYMAGLTILAFMIFYKPEEED